MKKPLLQVALDHIDTSSALASANILSPHVDVIEAGTLLCYAVGVNVVAKLRENYTSHIILADLKVADAGDSLAELVFSRGATWMTVICCAPIATMKAALRIAKQYNGDIQIELFGEWTLSQAKDWMQQGLKQVVYHRGRDAAAAGQQWSRLDIQRISNLADMGFDVSITGGLAPKDIELFKGLPVKCFIAGRSLYQSHDPARIACEFHHVIDAFWK